MGVNAPLCGSVLFILLRYFVLQYVRIFFIIILDSTGGEYRDRDLIIVTHRVVTKVLLCSLLGAGLNSFWKIKQDTACINQLEYDGSTFTVKTMNDVCHLVSLAQEETADF